MPWGFSACSSVATAARYKTMEIVSEPPLAPFDEDRHHQPHSKENPKVSNMSSLELPPQPPSSSSSTRVMAAKVGSSISDLGQSLFHNLDKVSSRLVGDDTALVSFFADQSASRRSDGAAEDGPHRLGTPPPSLPMLRVTTEASTSTDDDDQNSDLESVDDDKTVRADNKASTRQERRIVRLREDKRSIEQKREEISPKRDIANEEDGMPEVSPSTLSVTPPRARYRDRRAKTSRRPSQKRGELRNEGLPQIPELRKANTLVDGPACDGDKRIKGESNAKDVLRSLVLLPATGDEKVVTADPDPTEHSAKSTDNRASGIPLGLVGRKYEDASDYRHDSDVTDDDTTSNVKKNKKKRCHLSKLSIAAILLIVCGLVLILASTLRRSRANYLRGGSSSGASSTSSSLPENDSTASHSPTIAAADVPSTRMPTASPSKPPTVWTSTGLPPLDYTGTRGPHGLCKGDCDSNNDCMGGLVCYQRSGYEPVPGCDPMLGVKGADYCILPGGTKYPTVTPTSPPTPRPQNVLLESSSEASDESTTNIFETNAKESFSFYVTSKSPELFKTEQQLIDDGEFFIHLGDIFSAKDRDCDEEAYDDAANLLRKSKLPVLVLPGDEDWVDCTDIKPKKALKLWKNSFVGIEKTWKETSKVPSLVQRSGDYPENFAFLLRGVLFIGISNGRDEANEDEYKLREKETKLFIKSQVKTNEDDPSLRSIIAFAHTYQSDNDILDWISQRLNGKDVHVALVHGDEGPNKSQNGSFLDVPIDEALPPTKLTVLNGRLMTWGAHVDNARAINTGY